MKRLLLVVVFLAFLPGVLAFYEGQNETAFKVKEDLLTRSYVVEFEGKPLLNYENDFREYERSELTLWRDSPAPLRYTVYLYRPYLVMYAHLLFPIFKSFHEKRLEREHSDFKEELSKANIDVDIKSETFLTLNSIILATDETSATLSSIRGVNRVSEMPEFHFTEVADFIDLEEVNKIIKADKAHELGYTGAGIKVGVIDSGVDYNHPDLGGCFGSGCKVEGGYDFGDDDGDPMDSVGHGTHVASIIASVAPDARLYAYKVANGNALIGDEVVPAIERAVRDGMDIISMSLTSYPSASDSPDSRALRSAVESGVIFIVSASNCGNLRYSMVCSPYLMRGTYSVGNPASAKESIAVGATDKNDEIAAFSSFGPLVWDNKALIKPDVVAPGVGICAARWDDIRKDYVCLDNQHMYASGTSMSAPAVSGSVALVLQKFREKNLHLNQDDVKAILSASSVDVGEAINAQGLGSIDVMNALELDSIPPKVSIESQYYANKNIKVHCTFPPDVDNLRVELGDDTPPHHWTLLSTQKTGEFEFDTRDFNSGDKVLRLTAERDGIKSLAYSSLKITNAYIKSPAHNEVCGQNTKVIGNAIGKNFGRYVLKLVDSTGKESILKTSHSEVEGGILGTFSSSSYSQGEYFLVLEVYDKSDTLIDEYKVFVRLQPDVKEGWPQQYSLSCLGGNWCKNMGIQPAVADFTGDGKKELAFAVMGKLVVFNHRGEVLWEKQLRPSTTIFGPAAADINHDGKYELIVPDGFDIRVFDGLGNQLDQYSRSGDGGEQMVVEDVNDDGEYDYIYTDFWGDRAYHVLFGHSSNSIEIGSDDSSYKPTYPTVGDVNGDGEVEIVTLYIINNRKALVGVWDSAGNKISEWAVSDSFTDNTYAVLGDINKDGVEEIAFTSNGGKLFVFDGDGKSVLGSPINLCSENPGNTCSKPLTNPAMADINGDGFPEIILASYDTVFIIDSEGNKKESYTGAPPTRSIYVNQMSPLVVDVDGDGIMEIIFSRLYVSEYKNPEEFLIVETNGNLKRKIKIDHANYWSSKLVEDLDGDGRLELITFNWENLAFVFDLASSGEVSGKLEWPQPRHNTRRTGSYSAELTPPARKRPEAAFNMVPENPEVGENVNFDASASSDLDGTIVKYEWDFESDGVFDETGLKVSHSFPKIRRYDVVLKVIDDDGYYDTESKTVYVGLKPVEGLKECYDPNPNPHLVTSSSLTEGGGCIRLSPPSSVSFNYISWYHHIPDIDLIYEFRAINDLGYPAEVLASCETTSIKDAWSYCTTDPVDASNGIFICFKPKKYGEDPWIGKGELGLQYYYNGGGDRFLRYPDPIAAAVRACVAEIQPSPEPQEPNSILFYASCYDGESYTYNDEYGKITSGVGGAIASSIPVDVVTECPFPGTQEAYDKSLALEYSPYNHIFYKQENEAFAQKLASELEEYSPVLVQVVCINPPLDMLREAQNFLCNTEGERAYLALNFDPDEQELVGERIAEALRDALLSG